MIQTDLFPKFFFKESELSLLSHSITKHIAKGCILFLSGNLGAGKTTFAKNFLSHCGIKENITSPTFPILNTYEHNSQLFLHCDFYRLTSDEEIIALDIPFYLNADTTLLIEWPDKFLDELPEPSLHLHFFYEKSKYFITFSSNSDLSLTEKIVQDLHHLPKK